MTQPPRHASTVVLLRDRQGHGPELFMVKRHAKSGFMASAFVYPGGKLDAEDATPQAAEHCTGLTPAQAAAQMAPLGDRLDDDAQVTPEEALGLFLAAVREVFEEVGVLIANTKDGQTLRLDDPETKARFEGYRTTVHSGELSMTALAEREGLTYTLDALRYFAHWITPVVEKRRFNTRFFFALAPEGQTPLHDETETVDSAWLTPAEALERYNKAEIQLAPPTLRTLEDMCGFESTAALMASFETKSVVTIMPRFEQIDGNLTLLLPGDPRFPHPVGVEGPTRVEMSQGRWWSKTPGA